MLVDLGSMPLANSFVTPDEAAHEPSIPRDHVIDPGMKQRIVTPR